MLSYAKACHVLDFTYWTAPYKMSQTDILAYCLTIKCFPIDFFCPLKEQGFREMNKVRTPYAVLRAEGTEV